MGRRWDLWPFTPQIDKLAQTDRKMWRTHQRMALIMTSWWNPLVYQEVSSWVFSYSNFSVWGEKKVSVSLWGPSFLSFSWPGVGIETESKQSGSDSISYLNAHIVCGKTVISLFSLLCTKLTLPGARHRWRYKVLAFRRHCLGPFLGRWESII